MRVILIKRKKPKKEDFVVGHTGLNEYAAYNRYTREIKYLYNLDSSIIYGINKFFHL
jgi:hypothetical protein